ncbi:hypothetical protein Q8W71_27615 [Methylobacterium sp. NEAU 140]|uniref:hypothetical protein n=1 Tax=Methylobacterium sp. NEAU 140 TaxID=3064945 RepID=UPI002736D59D|nr:hypothetical protein [Methylobacterium sp. NEAU 140]MDP4026397.1 hypothetical protein [Methylobacterium sp. NEAU 140]
MLLAQRTIEQPVELARALCDFGLSLGVAHDVLNRLARGERVPVTLHLTASGETPFALCRFGLEFVQPAVPARVSSALETVSPDIRSAIESWARSQPSRPALDAAVDLILRTYLTEHGLLSGLPARPKPELHGRT